MRCEFGRQILIGHIVRLNSDTYVTSGLYLPLIFPSKICVLIKFRFLSEHSKALGFLIVSLKMPISREKRRKQKEEEEKAWLYLQLITERGKLK